MMFPSFKRPALFALSASTAVMAQMTTSDFSPTNAVSDTPSAQITSASSSASIGTVLLHGTPTTYSVQYTLPAAIDVGANLLPNIEDPEAKVAQAVCPGYRASNVEHTQHGFTASLSLAGAPCNVYGTDIEDLNITIAYQSSHRLSVNISPAFVTAENSSHYILPSGIVYKPEQGVPDEPTEDIDLQFVWSNDPTFSFAVLRKSTGDVIFSTEGTVLVYEDQFIEFVSALPENYNLYGMGENLHGIRLGDNYTTTFYAADNGNPIDRNLYGVHPMYVDTRYYEKDPVNGTLSLLTGDTDTNASYISYSHGVYLRNAHGMEALMQNGNITWRALGGSIDLYFFDGPTQAEVTKQYQLGAVGLPAMQQYWTFGYHQCRWGYKNWTMMQDVVDNFAKFEIPMETIWNDIDYMFQYRDFENDPNTFPYDQGKQFIDGLHANGQHYVTIVDSAIYIPNPDNETDAYSVYSRGHELDVFMKNADGSEYIGAVWPGFTVFPDWHAENASQWWTESLMNWYQNVQVDGIWIDMSEVSSFCVGSCGTGQLHMNPVHPPFDLPGEPGSVDYNYPEGFNVTNSTEYAIASSKSAIQVAANSATMTSTTTQPYLRTTPTAGVRNVDHPPYVINNQLGDLAVHAVAPNATHSDGVEEYDIHNLFGLEILNATYNALTQTITGKRPFIIGRSTFAGAGQYAGHWGGDNYATWESMLFSIPQALDMALFGIPMFGADTCGFSGNSDEELCNRWMQLSAFFPFYRNHNTLDDNSQEPYIWGSVIDASKRAMAIRYSLLPYMYTLFHMAHTTGSTVMRAMAWEFPHDPSLIAANRQFMLGPSLLITPVLIPLATTVNGVFPGIKEGTVWYDWYNQTAVSVAPGANITLDAPLGHINVHIRGGSVLPQQEAALTTTASRNSSWSVIAALSAEGTATGSLYIDDGESIIQNSTLFVDFTAENDRLYASARGLWQEKNALANVTVLGVQNAPSNVTLNGQALFGFNYNSTTKVLKVTGLQNATSSGAWANDWVLQW
ncbi:putative alpha-glucosidase [Aureobasidium pullulans]|uniref:alpha-glucosidase n=1 Tax=Aureobasidium pullulans TaxID=5580 RepID=A0A4V4JWV8_AURPU|nr:putative alpha-glucosidase [Aureobasidium pullulans]